MTKETNKQIIASAPEGATHFDGGVWAQSTGKQPLEKWNDMDWDYEDAYEMYNIRSLDDIRENIALQERIAELEEDIRRIESQLIRYQGNDPSFKAVRVNAIKGGDS